MNEDLIEHVVTIAVTSLVNAIAAIIVRHKEKKALRKNGKLNDNKDGISVPTDTTDFNNSNAFKDNG